MNLVQISIGIGLAALVAYAAFRLKALSVSGAAAAFVLGAIVFGLGGLPWAVVLLVFFISSSALSRSFRLQKSRAEEKFSKGSQRDAWQVLANGGVAGIAVFISLFFQNSVIPWLMFATAFVAANADTWATELGVLNKTWPRSIRNWQRVPPGTSGGVSPTGILAAIGGSLLIAAAAFLVWPAGRGDAGDRLVLSLIILLSGLAGSLVDSWLGATIQAIYWCPECRKETERSPLHSCGSPTDLIRGWKWLNNDLVNLVCTLSAALVSFLLYIVCF